MAGPEKYETKVGTELLHSYVLVLLFSFFEISAPLLLWIIGSKA